MNPTREDISPARENAPRSDLPPTRLPPTSRVGSERGANIDHPQPIAVDSFDDPRLVDFIDLKNRSLERASRQPHFVVEGHFLVSRLIASGFHVRAIVVQSGHDLSKLGRIDRSVPIYQLSAEQIRELTGFPFHRGFLASATRRPLLGLSDFQPDDVSLGLIQINDMENAGSMLRSAAAFGIRQVLVDRQSVDVYSRRVLRVSMGAAFGMRFVRLGDLRRDLAELKERGVATLAATLGEDSTEIDALSLGGRPAVLLMGNEARGLPRRVEESVAERVHIPMGMRAETEDLVDSLNVSVAAAILMHELAKRGPSKRGENLGR